MTISILRTDDAWWVATESGATKIASDAATTRELLADRATIEARRHRHRHACHWRASR